MKTKILKWVAGALPDRLRASRASARRAAKRRKKLKSCDLVIVSKAKSGRTWLAAMISHIYHQRFGLPENEIIRFDNFHRLDPRAPRILFSHDNVKDAGRHALFVPEDWSAVKVLLLVRDPRDIAVSAYFQSLRNAKKVGADSVVRGDGGPMFDYVALRKLPQVIAFLKRWQAQLPGIKGAMVVRYEDLRVRPEAELARVMAFIDGEPPRQEEIESAVAFASFDNLRAKEAANFFSTDRLRPADPSDPDSFKVRRGKVGGYRDYFTPQEQARMEAMVADAKLETFGYLPRPTAEEG